MKKRYPSKNPYAYLSSERKADMQRYLHNNEVISIFCDCSVNPEKTKMGLAFCMVGDSQFNIKSVQLQISGINNIHGEILAINFVLERVPRMMDRYRNLLRRPKRVVIYSDLDNIERILGYNHENDMAAIIEEVAKRQTNFINTTGFELSIKYMEAERKDNLYYKAAHNAARKAINLK